MKQLDLFSTKRDICANRHRGDRESQQAFERVDTERDRAVVLEIIQEQGANGATLDEISAKLDRPPNCLSGRITELKTSGLIRPSGSRRPTRTGSMAKVYVCP